MRQEVEIVRKVDGFAVGDRFRGPRAWCERLIAYGWAKAVSEPEPEKKRRRRREVNEAT